MSFEEVRGVIVDTLACDAEQVTLDATLMEDLSADSLSIVELTMALEEKSGITIDDEATAKLKTVGDIVQYLNAHQS
ncbi:acyl carrier protein [Oscillibacter sp. MSJ-2]|uniref:Acyl carrier protein n=1 Tax=Dysosmobacter acutus TaxID=2841504 RepID=A0ABS6F8R6_9FIRM|nr:acyl carrier protein [Dysosmobacter acutus]MBU5626671.1 acyl carrier protein [Dysosmobacter acutus]